MRSLRWLGIALLLGASAALAGEKPIDAEFEKVQLADVAKLVESLHHVSIVAPEYVAKREVTVKAAGLSPEAFVKLVAKEAEATVVSTEGRRFVLADDWKGRIERGLETETSAELDGTPMEIAFATIEAACHVAIVLDTGEPRISRSSVAALKVASISGRNLLALLGSFTSTAFEPRWGVVLVSTPARLAALPPGPITPAENADASDAAKATRHRIVDEQIAKEIAGASAAEAAKALGAATGLTIAIAEPAKKAAGAKAKVRLPAKLSLEHALTLLLAPSGLAYEIGADGEIRVIPAKK